MDGAEATLAALLRQAVGDVRALHQRHDDHVERVARDLRDLRERVGRAERGAGVDPDRLWRLSVGAIVVGALVVADLVVHLWLWEGR